MKRMRFWDSISTILVLFGFGFIWQQLLLWRLDAGICSAWTYHSRCDHCPVYAALSVLPPLSRYDVLFQKENILSALRQ